VGHLRSGYLVADGALDSMANVKTGTREARLKAALRENLKRRKAQARLCEENAPDSGAVAEERPDAPSRPGK
jgi:sulfur relay (sulfurtransferase) complex TusBCD TusD component (DsrE family)